MSALDSYEHHNPYRNTLFSPIRPFPLLGSLSFFLFFFFFFSSQAFTLPQPSPLYPPYPHPLYISFDMTAAKDQKAPQKRKSFLPRPPHQQARHIDSIYLPGIVDF